MNEKKAKTDVVWAETDCSRTERIAAGQNGLQPDRMDCREKIHSENLLTSEDLLFEKNA